MVKINLLPHREEKRKLRKNAFVAMMVAALLVGGLIVAAVAAMIAGQISDQAKRNEYIKSENAKLDIQIKEVATLKEEIEALKARQQAVEDLQSDRNQPVHLMDELVKQVPEGIYLRSFKQENQRVVLNGYAQSNERVSELLRNLGNNSAWLERPELIEIKSTGSAQNRDAKRIFDFTVTVGIKRPRDKEAKDSNSAQAGDGKAGTAGVPFVARHSAANSGTSTSSGSKTDFKISVGKDKEHEQAAAKSSVSNTSQSSRSSRGKRR